MASSDSDSGYEVDTILKQRKRKGILEYLVRWKGFEETEDTWEPEKNLQHCPNVIKNFIKKSTELKKSRGKSRSRSRSRSRAGTKKPKSPKTTSSRSRSRSSSRSRVAEKEKAVRQSRQTEVITKTTTLKTQGRTEKETQIIKETSNKDEIDHVENTTRIVQSKLEVKTIEADIKPKPTVDVYSIGTYFHDIWQTIDTAALILFICVTIFVLSYIVEKYVSPPDLTGVFSSVTTAVSGAVKAVYSGAGNIWQAVAGNTSSKITKH